VESASRVNRVFPVVMAKSGSRDGMETLGRLGLADPLVIWEDRVRRVNKETPVYQEIRETKENVGKQETDYQGCRGLRVHRGILEWPSAQMGSQELLDCPVCLEKRDCLETLVQQVFLANVVKLDQGVQWVHKVPLALA